MLGVIDMMHIIRALIPLSEERLFFPRKKIFFGWEYRGKQLDRCGYRVIG